MDKQLPRGLGHVQAVLEEFVDGKEGLLIQRIQGVLLENLPQEDLAQGGRQLDVYKRQVRTRTLFSWFSWS